MFGRGVTRLQPAYVEDVAEAIGRLIQRAETPSLIFELAGPRIYSYEEFLRAIAHQAGLAPLLIQSRLPFGTHSHGPTKRFRVRASLAIKWT